MKASGKHEVYVDMGYCDHHYAGKATIHVDKRQQGQTPKSLAMEEDETEPPENLPSDT